MSAEEQTQEEDDPQTEDKPKEDAPPKPTKDEKQDEKKKKKKKKKKLKDLAEEYGLTQDKKTGLWLPEYFVREERYGDRAEENVAVFQANNFFLGMDIFAEQGSCSVKLTYIGQNRRYTFKSVIIARRIYSPKKNNWKVWSAPVRLWKDKEAPQKIKDPKLVRDLIFSQGGKANFTIRFVVDKDFQQEEEKKKVFAKDPSRLMRLPYRIKKDQAKLGVKPTLMDLGEAQKLLEDLKVEMKETEQNQDIIGFVQSEIKRFEEIKRKQAEQAKKD